ncbi:hypothetical protein Syun_007151 [Stephania yunnanensis]|uniref:Uncharacterized protein n=1 Tax=Stephania yunnanensis TaxID=152371 RepID=A0AAP0PZ53_9MAGN
MSGRRLRHVNAERRLEEWKAEVEVRRQQQVRRGARELRRIWWMVRKAEAGSNKKALEPADLCGGESPKRQRRISRSLSLVSRDRSALSLSRRRQAAADGSSRLGEGAVAAGSRWRGRVLQTREQQERQARERQRQADE